MKKVILLSTMVALTCSLLIIEKVSADIKKTIVEGEAEFKKEGYIEKGGTYVRQRDACTVVSITGDKLNAEFDLRMAKECFDEETFTNSPCMNAIANVTNKGSTEHYFGYKVFFFDKDMNEIGVVTYTDVADAGSGSSMFGMPEPVYVNIPLSKIMEIERYKIVFLESDQEITDTDLKAMK